MTPTVDTSALQHLRVLTGDASPEPSPAATSQEEPDTVGETAAAQEAEPETPASPPTASEDAVVAVPQPRTSAKASGSTARRAPAGKKPVAGTASPAAKEPRTSRTTAKKKTVAASPAARADEPAKAASPLLKAAIAILHLRRGVRLRRGLLRGGARLGDAVS
ncbi:hypothetical protein ACFYWU_40780 [Streptomyces chrestomyceticus]|uniref:hypothetical protein n=1 Tax=Streptomyces chrestomyceticus TaxID=68185 RepID=UPI0036B89C2A